MRGCPDHLPGVIANPARLRTMLGHLTKTLHPGVLDDCFYQSAAALCAKRAKPAARPLPLLDACATCPNARRSTVHLPRLTAARDQAQHLLGPTTRRCRHCNVPRCTSVLSR